MTSQEQTQPSTGGGSRGCPASTEKEDKQLTIISLYFSTLLTAIDQAFLGRFSATVTNVVETLSFSNKSLSFSEIP